MALDLEQIRSIAARVASSHGLDVVNVEYQSAGGKHRILRVFIEKNAEHRAKIAPISHENDPESAAPSRVELEHLSGITHEDCQVFSQDFGTLLDVEDVIPGAEYTLEVSSPGLDRKLQGEADFRRFAGSLVKLQTSESIAGNRHWQGRLTEVKQASIVLDPSAMRPKGKGKKQPASEPVEIPLVNIEKAHLVPEI